MTYILQRHQPLVLLFIFVNGPWITNSIRLDFIIVSLIIISELFKVALSYRINYIFLLLLIMLFTGTIVGFYLGNKDYRLYMSAYDSYLRIYIGFVIAKKISERYSFHQFLRYTVYILPLPTYLITLLWFVEADLCKEIITTIFSTKINTWHRFSGIYGLPYLASIPLSINIFTITYLLLNEKKLILLVFYVINAFIGIITISKTFTLGIILSVILLAIYSFRSTKFLNLLYCGTIISLLIIYLSLFPDYDRFQSFTFSGIDDALTNRYSLSSSEVSAGQNIDNWHWLYGLGMGKSYAAMDSFFVELYSFYGIIGALCFMLIIFHLFKPILLSKNLNIIVKYYYIFLFIFLFIAGLGSSSFNSDRSEVLIWTLISFGYINSFRRPIYGLVYNYQKHLN